MPVVKIDLWEGRDLETKDKLIVNVSKAVCASLDVEAETVHVILNEVSTDNWGIHGKTATKFVEEKKSQ